MKNKTENLASKSIENVIFCSVIPMLSKNQDLCAHHLW